MSDLFGDFVEIGPATEFLILSFSSSSLPVQERWRNNSLSADFLANYWETFLFAQLPAELPGQLSVVLFSSHRLHTLPAVHVPAAARVTDAS